MLRHRIESMFGLGEEELARIADDFVVIQNKASIHLQNAWIRQHDIISCGFTDPGINNAITGTAHQNRDTLAAVGREIMAQGIKYVSQHWTTRDSRNF